MAIIQVDDISVAVGGRFVSLRYSHMSQGGRHLFKGGSGVAFQGNWYVLKPLITLGLAYSGQVCQFVPALFQVSLETPVNGTVAMLPAAEGHVYEEGTEVRLSAVAAAGYRFRQWLIDGEVVTEASPVVLMDKDRKVSVLFEWIPVVRHALEYTGQVCQAV